MLDSVDCFFAAYLCGRKVIAVGAAYKNFNDLSARR